MLCYELKQIGEVCTTREDILEVLFIVLKVQGIVKGVVQMTILF